MHVKLLQAFTLRQKETVRTHIRQEFLEYGIHIPGLLHSTRQHKLSQNDAQSCYYESVFRLQGLLAPLVGLLLGNRLRRGFSAMTEGLKREAEHQHQA